MLCSFLPVIFSVRIIYAVVVLIKLYLAATTPGEIQNIINEKDLHLDEYMAGLEQSFKSIMERDRLSPHTKFLYVIQRLNERYKNIKRRQAAKKEGIELNDTNCTTTQQANLPGPGNSANSANRIGGLQILSEVAVGSGSNGSPQQLQGSASAPVGTPADTPLTPARGIMSAPQPQHQVPPQHQQQHPQQAHQHEVHQHEAHQHEAHQHEAHQHEAHQHSGHHAPVQHPQTLTSANGGWYAQTADDMSNAAAVAAMQQQLDTSTPGGEEHGSAANNELYDFPSQLNGLDVFDYSLASMGIGVDSALTGLFMENGGLWGVAPTQAWLGGWQG